MHVPEVEYNAAADDAEASAQNGRKDRRKGTGCGNHDENKQVREAQSWGWSVDRGGAGEWMSQSERLYDVGRGKERRRDAPSMTV